MIAKPFGLGLLPHFVFDPANLRGEITRQRLETVSTMQMLWSAKPWMKILVFPIAYSLFGFQPSERHKTSHWEAGVPPTTHVTSPPRTHTSLATPKRVAQELVSTHKSVKGRAVRITSTAHIHIFQKTQILDLTFDICIVPLVGFLAVIGLNASDVMWCACPQSGHQSEHLTR